MNALLDQYFEFEFEGIVSLEFDNNILRATYFGNLEELKAALLECPGSINAQESFSGSTALHIAASHGNYSLVSYLLSVPGIDASIRNYFDEDAMDLAWKGGHGEIFKLICVHLYPSMAEIYRDDPSPS